MGKQVTGIAKLRWLLFEKPALQRTYRDLKLRPDLLTPGSTACLGCSAELALRFTLRVLGPRTIIALPPSCMAGVGASGFGMTTGMGVPVVQPLLTNTAALLSGIKRHYQRLGREVPVVAFAGDGGSADAGFQALSGAAERGENIIYICYDNEGYMNTGVQRSATTPLRAWTTTTPVGVAGRGKGQPSKDMPLIMAMHGVPYVATANVAYPADYRAKLERAMAVRDGLSYIHLFSPCPTGWRFAADQTIEVNRRAVETNFFPLWEAVYGRFRFTKRVALRKPISTYHRLMGKYEHLTPAETAEVQRWVDGRYRRLRRLTRL